MSGGRERLQILEAILAHVPFDGWTEKSFKAAARDLNMEPGDMERLFPHGPRDAIDVFLRQADQDMLAAAEEADLNTLKIRERIATLIKARITAMAPHREAARRAAVTLALPGNADLALRCLYRTVDLMWQAAGDRSADWNYYTKRMTLAGVYSATFLYWLGDHSLDYEETWGFVDRRIDDVMRIEKTKARLRESVANLPSLARILGRLRYPHAGPT